MVKQVKKEGLTTNKIYMAALAIATVIFVIAVILVIIKPFEYRSFDKLQTITPEELTTKEIDGSTKASYYVLIYEADNDENEMIGEKIVEYANYAKDNEDALPIFVLEYTKNNASAIEAKLPSSFDVSDEFPCLAKITSNKVAQVYPTVSTILNILEEEMAK